MAGGSVQNGSSSVFFKASIAHKRSVLTMALRFRRGEEQSHKYLHKRFQRIFSSAAHNKNEAENLLLQITTGYHPRSL